jgi:AbrB family looped-hinge helix DNA binding protein
MRTTVSQRGQTVIPAALRGRYNIKEGDQLEWLDTGGAIKVIPSPADPIEALYGRGRGEGFLQVLLEERARDRERE